MPDLTPSWMSQLIRTQWRGLLCPLFLMVVINAVNFSTFAVSLLRWMNPSDLDLFCVPDASSRLSSSSGISLSSSLNASSFIAPHPSSLPCSCPWSLLQVDYHHCNQQQKSYQELCQSCVPLYSRSNDTSTCYFWNACRAESHPFWGQDFWLQFQRGGLRFDCSWYWSCVHYGSGVCGLL